MKFFVGILTTCLLLISLQAKSYIYIEKGIKLPLKDQKVTLYNGVPVDVISKNKDIIKVKLSGYVSKKDSLNLYATKNLKLLLATTTDKNLIKTTGEKGVLEVSVPAKSLTSDMDEAWAANSDLFYDKCTKCHHAKIIEKHNMQEWNALFGSMKYKAKTTKPQNALILRFLRAFAKDGILRQSD